MIAVIAACSAIVMAAALCVMWSALAFQVRRSNEAWSAWEAAEEERIAAERRLADLLATRKTLTMIDHRSYLEAITESPERRFALLECHPRQGGGPWWN